jgi:C4-dicarboxylate transporter DctM subunit
VATPSSFTPGAERGERPGTAAERLLVALALLLMVLLPAASALSRRLLGRELLGAAVLAQHLTLWVGFLGALLATASDRHLALSTRDHFPAGLPRDGARFLANAVSAAACALLAYGSVRLVRYEWGSTTMVAFGIKVAWSQIVLVVGFGAMALRFAWAAGDWRWRAGAVALAALSFALGTVAPPPWLVVILGLTVFAAFLAGAPVFVGMAGVALVLFFGDTAATGTPAAEAVAAVPTAVFQVASEPALPALPLLTLSGYVLAEGAAAQRLVRAYKGLFGWLPGGLAVMTAFACAVFTTFTGASGVTILALGGVLLPSLLAERYPEDFSVGLVTASGSLGLLFPPSLPVILYAVVAQVPVADLFIGGLLPGLLMVLLVAAYGVYVGRRAGAPRQRFDPKEAVAALWAAKWDLGLPTVVVGAIASGHATIVEAAAIAAAYALFVELVVYRSIGSAAALLRVLSHAAALVGSVVILLGAAYGLTNWFVDADVATRLVEWMTAHVRSPALFLLLLNAALLVLGSVLEMYSAIVVIAPLVAPLGRAYGVEPIHLGVVFLANLELGFLFPPLGLNLFLSATRFSKPLPWVYRKALPFLLIMAAGVLAITYLPAITTGVVGLFR